MPTTVSISGTLKIVGAEGFYINVPENADTTADNSFGNYAVLHTGEWRHQLDKYAVENEFTVLAEAVLPDEAISEVYEPSAPEPRKGWVTKINDVQDTNGNSVWYYQRWV